MKTLQIAFGLVGFVVLIRPAPAQTFTDIGTTAPSTYTYDQPQHVSGSAGPDAISGVGEEFMLSASDVTLNLTAIYVKSAGNSNTGGSGASQTVSWTLNLYNITAGTELPAETFNSTTAANSDYLEFTLSPTESAEATLVGGDTYAFTLTTTTDYYLAGQFKNQETSGYEPAGITSEEAITGNGSVSSLQAYNDPVNGQADALYYLQTSPSPEPPAWFLVLLGLPIVFLCSRKKALLAKPARI